MDRIKALFGGWRDEIATWWWPDWVLLLATLLILGAVWGTR